MSFQPSSYQLALREEVLHGQGDLMVSAVAGSGKTSSLVWIVNELPKEMLRDVLFCAFNKEIVNALVKKLPSGANVATNHSIGFRTLGRHFSPDKRWEVRVDDRKFRRLIRLYYETKLNVAYPEMEEEAELFKLLHFARVTLTKGENREAIEQMVVERELELSNPDRQIEALPTLLQWGLEGLPFRDPDSGLTFAAKETIDFDDMLWLPWKLNLCPQQYGFVMVDESQDLSACQLSICMRSRRKGGRMLFVGDPKQAINAFSGADNDAWNRIQQHTSATVLPLSICYRCPKDVIDLCKNIVPQIEARENAPEGVVEQVGEDRFLRDVNPGDMVLCRTNAPTVKMAFKLIANGKPARVKGRDIGKQLEKVIDAIERRDEFQFEAFLKFSAEYLAEQISALSRKKDGEMLVASLCDKVESVEAIYQAVLNQGGKNIDALRAWTEDLFTDTGRGQVLLSSIHRAKGLESDRVWWLHPELCPHPMAKTPAQQTQEMHLIYVAASRAMQELYFVGPIPTPLLPPDLPEVDEEEAAPTPEAPEPEPKLIVTEAMLRQSQFDIDIQSIRSRLRENEKMVEEAQKGGVRLHTLEAYNHDVSLLLRWMEQICEERKNKSE